MTESELRQKVADVAQKYIGAIQGSVKHKDLLTVYNTHTPLARGYHMTEKDPWCATFVSAVSIICGLTDIMPTECSCGKMVALYQKIGRWQEDEKTYRPKIGDVIFYYWDDGWDYKKTDQKGAPNHVGIVTELNGDSFTVTEGNRKVNNVSQVAYRIMEVNGRYIRGYGVPDYASKANKAWYSDSMEKAKALGLIDGTRPLDYATRAEVVSIALRLYDLLS